MNLLYLGLILIGGIIIIAMILVASIWTSFASLKKLILTKLEEIESDVDVIHMRLLSVEKVYRGHIYAKCPQCNRVAIASAGCEGVKFICPHCEALSVWSIVEIKNRVSYLLIPDKNDVADKVIPPIIKELEMLSSAKR